MNLSTLNHRFLSLSLSVFFAPVFSLTLFFLSLPLFFFHSGPLSTLSLSLSPSPFPSLSLSLSISLSLSLPRLSFLCLSPFLCFMVKTFCFLGMTFVQIRFAIRWTLALLFFARFALARCYFDRFCACSFYARSLLFVLVELSLALISLAPSLSLSLGTHRVRWTWYDQKPIPDGTSTGVCLLPG